MSEWEKCLIFEFYSTHIICMYVEGCLGSDIIQAHKHTPTIFCANK